MNGNELKERISTTAFALRGYNVTNTGRNKELLEHRAYGPIVERVLKESSEACSDIMKQEVDLAERVRAEKPADLESFGVEVAMIIAMELAQLKLLEEFFNISFKKAPMMFGYSVGEASALVAGEVFTLKQILKPLTILADECAELAQDVTMGVLFSRPDALDIEKVESLCVHISSQGQGMIAMSAQLSPNTVLLLGQGSTIDRFKQAIPGHFKGKVLLRENPDKWPPIHTPLMWNKNITNRAALELHNIGGGFKEPTPPILSLVTGGVSYNDYNAREHLVNWLDHPQLLWEVISEMLAEGIETVIHVGPQPNLIPATFKRLSNNVTNQLEGSSIKSFGLRAISAMSRRSWMRPLMTQQSALLRAPYIEHVILEDWLLDQNGA